MIVRRGAPMRRGVGDVCSDGPGAPWSWQRIKYTTMMCNNPYNNAGPMPSPPAPTISLTANANTPGAVYAGQDSSGAAVYAVPETAQENMDRTKAALDVYFAKVGDANPPPPPDDPCAHWYSFMNPDCNGATGYVFAAAAAVGVLVLGVALSGGRR